MCSSQTEISTKKRISLQYTPSKMSSAAARGTGNGNAPPNEEEMEVVYLHDKGGSSLKLYLFEGKYYSPWLKLSRIRSVGALDLRRDDIYFPSYPRTGTHWTFEMTSMLLNGSAETIPDTKGEHHIELISEEQLSALPSPRVLMAHMYLSDAPKQLVEKKCKIIYKLRDPKDVAVSLYNVYMDFPSIFNYRGNFEDFLYLFLEEKVDINGIFGHWRDAEKFCEEHPDNPVHFQVYEETIENPLLEVQKLSDFLGLERNDQLCRHIAGKCSFSRMKVDKPKDQTTLYRKGIVGDWKNWFTDEMLEDYYRVYEEKMAGSRFYERYARTKYES